MESSVLLTYGLLLFSIIALWFKVKLFSKIPLWLCFGVASVIAGFLFGFLEIQAVIYLGLLGCAVFQYYKKDKPVLYFVAILILTVPLLLHLPILGFHNYKYLDRVQVSENAFPFSMYFNLDKTFLGVYILGFSAKESAASLPEIIQKVLLYLLVMAILFFGITMSLAYVKWDLKGPSYTLIWMLNNLFFVCVAEEAVFRKLIQDKIIKWVSKPSLYWFSILITSFLFGIVHLQGGIVYVILASIAGLFYGHLYYVTKRIESAVLLHFLFNLVHFLLFTYPALRV